MAIAFFDVDGTLIGGASSESRFMFELARRGTLGPGQAAATLWFFARWGRRFGRHTARRNKAYLAGLLVARIEELAAGFVATRLAASLRQPVADRLAWHRDRGDTIILLTGTPTFIAAPLARLLGGDDHIATRLAEAGGRFLAGPPLSHPFGRDKLALAAALCRERDIALGDCAAYGDSIYDLALLRRVGRPVAVAPDARLRKAALTRGWEIIEESPRGSTAARRDSADAAQDYARSPLR